MPKTSAHNYFEDLEVGCCFEHTRGRTVSNEDNVFITHLTLNTAQAHFNLDYMKTMMDGSFDERLVMGGVTTSIVIGMTSQDISENALRDLGLDKIRLKSPVYKDDTLYARSEILETSESVERPDAGMVRYRFTGFKAGGQVVVEGERSILVKRRSHWPRGD